MRKRLLDFFFTDRQKEKERGHFNIFSRKYDEE